MPSIRRGLPPDRRYRHKGISLRAPAGACGEAPDDLTHRPSEVFYSCATMDRRRFDPELLYDDDPFEIDDDNRPHLAKHYPHSPDDLFDARADPNHLFVAATAEGPADWLLVARVEGQVVQVPLAAPRNGGWRTCRPIGIYPANAGLVALYEEDQ